MSLQDQRRYVEALHELTEDDLDAGTTIDALEAHLGGRDLEVSAPDRLRRLWQVGYVELDLEGGSVRLTPKGLWALGKGPRPD